MEFLGVGYQELLLVLVLMLVFVGPERLPEMAYQIGKAVRTLQKYARAVRDEFSEEIGYVEEQYRTILGEVDATRVSLRDEHAKINAEFRDATEPVRLTTPNDPPAGNGLPFAGAEGDPPASVAAAERDLMPEAEKAPPLLF